MEANKQSNLNEFVVQNSENKTKVSNNQSVKGRIHSVETFGAVDGPGIRYVVFLQGCLLRCMYCHNPDTWTFGKGRLVSSEDLVGDIKQYKNYLKSGGVTISGGEPLMQVYFCEDVLRRLSAEGIHTALDTSGAIPLELSKKSLELSDLVMLDIKALNEEMCVELSGRSRENTLATLDYLREIKKSTWIRHVLLPGYTLDVKLLEELADYLKDYPNIEMIELLPFHKMGEYKWEEMGEKYRLYDTEQPTNEQVEEAKKIFTDRGLVVKGA